MLSGLFCYLSKSILVLSRLLSNFERIRWTNRNVNVCMGFSLRCPNVAIDSHE